MNMATIELSLYEALTDIGVKPDVARKVERQMEGIITQSQETVRAQMHQQLMTKGDGAELKAELKADGAELKGDIAQVRGEISQVREELKGDIAQVRGEISQVREELKGDIAQVRGEISQVREELKGDIAQVRGEISQVREEVAHLRTDVHKAIRNQTLSLAVLIVAVAGLMLTVFK